ncbi:MAG: sterol desaturase family protein [Bacteroidia bacterium]
MAGIPKKGTDFRYPRIFFRQPWEWFSRYRKHNTLLAWIFYGVIIAGMVGYAYHLGQSVLHIGGLVVGGLFTWTFAEYLLHRFLLHWVDQRPWVKRWHNFIHGAHHDVPKDLRFVTASVFVTLPVALVFLGVFWLILGQGCWGFFSGFGLGYLLYEYTHYAIHKYP